MCLKSKDVHKFEAPFDERFRDLMTETAESLMTYGFRVIYAYTESDEISLLFDRNELTINTWKSRNHYGSSPTSL